MKTTTTVATTIVLNKDHGYKAGDTICCTVKDRRIWKRFLCFVMFKKSPTIVEKYEITHVTGVCITI